MIARSALPRVAIVLVIVAGALALTPKREHLDLAWVETSIRELGVWAFAGHVLLFALGTVLFVPGAIFGLAGGLLFGPLWGTLFNLAGATLGATAAFLATRYVAANWVRRQAAGQLARLMTGVEAEGWRFVAFVRLVPLFPFNLLNFALGLTRIPLVHYVLASHLHGARHIRLYLARACRPRGACRQRWRDSLGSDRPRPSRDRRVLTAARSSTAQSDEDRVGSRSMILPAGSGPQQRRHRMLDGQALSQCRSVTTPSDAALGARNALEPPAYTDPSSIRVRGRAPRAAPHALRSDRR